MRIILLLSSILCFLVASAQTDFTAIDSFAQNAPNGVDRDTATVAEYLLKGCHNDMEKARAVFSWIANNIKYDDNAYNTGKYGNMSANGVIKRRHAVCEGYANLYKALANAMGLEAERIDGWAKAYGYRPGQKLTGTNPNHAWNAVKVNGEWILLDATWGSGTSVGGRGQLNSKRLFSPYWFNVNPYDFLFMHYPQNDKWLLVPQSLTLKQYEDMPFLEAGFFQLGFSGRDIFDKVMSKTSPKLFPQAYPSKYHITLLNFPVDGVMAPAPEVTFSLTCSDDLDIVIVNDPRTFSRMERSGNTYSVKMPVKRGELKVCVKRGKSHDYDDLIVYKVK